MEGNGKKPKAKTVVNVMRLCVYPAPLWFNAVFSCGWNKRVPTAFMEGNRNSAFLISQQ